MQLKKYRRKNINNVIGGRTAKIMGEQFENILKASFKKHGAAIVQIPSGCKWVTGYKAISVPTPFDFFACKNGVPIAFDAKTVNKETFSKSEVKAHQVLALHDLENAGMKAGYLVWFRPCEKVVFFSSLQLIKLLPRKSLKVDDGICLGSIKDLNLNILI